MNRQTILACVHRQLRDSLAETGEVRPLGEIVPRVAKEIRQTSNLDVTELPAVISIERVAAFVDGDLEHSEADEICKAVMVDNSVLAEIIAAVRTTLTPSDQPPDLSPALSTRLLAMHAALGSGEDADSVRQSVATNHSIENQPSEVHVRVAPAGSTPRAQRSVDRRWVVAGALAAIAATAVGMVVLTGRERGNAPDENLLAGDRTIDHQPIAEAPDSIPDLSPDSELSPRTPAGEIAAASSPPIDDVEAPEIAVGPDPTDIVAGNSAPAVGSPSSPDESSSPAPRETMPPPPANLNPLEDNSPVRIAAAPRAVEVRWTEVDGLLAQRNESSNTIGSAQASSIAATRGGGSSWKSIQAGAPSSTQQASEVSLRTLPFSRAKGEFGTVGQIVVAGDTGLLIEQGDEQTVADLNLMYGSVALIGVGEGTTVRVKHGVDSFTTLRWQTKASAVLQRFGSGLQIQVDGGDVQVNDQEVKGGSVQVTADRTVQKIRSPKRLPRWVTRAEDSTPSERLILAQIAESDDLMASLNQNIRSLASSKTLRRDDQRVLSRLARWQAAMAGPNIYRLAGNRIPAVRIAALQHLASLPETDPRYEETWNTIDRIVNNPQRSIQVRNWFRLIRNNARPNAAQMEQMLLGLSNRDYAGRALSDFILRQYVRNPPPFDPSWTGATLQRAIKIYRDRAGMPIDRVRPNATSATGVR